MTLASVARSCSTPGVPLWETYEDVAREIISRFRDDLGLGRIEPKQGLDGASGTEWEIDVVAYASGSDRRVIFECRHYEDKRVSQEEVGGFAYRISDLGAAKGYLVTPIGLQSGAAEVARYEKIDLITLSYDATIADYAMRFLNRVFVGISETVTVTESLSLEIVRAKR